MAHFSYLDVVAKLSVPEHRQFKQALEYVMEILALRMDFD